MSGCQARRLRQDDARFIALEFFLLRELAAQEFDVTTGTRAGVGTKKTHAEEKNNHEKDVWILEGFEQCPPRLAFVLGRREERLAHGRFLAARECQAVFRSESLK